MAAIICQKCGTTAGPTDRFCRTCGSPIISATAGDENARDGQPDRGEAGLAGSPISPPKKTSNCLIAAASYVLVMLVLGVVIFIALTSQASGKPVISIVLVGTPTSYPTFSPYRTATPFPFATPYPTVASYPTTGPIEKHQPGTVFIHPYASLDGCLLIVNNQNPDLDSVAIFTDVSTQKIVAAMYVRASDSFTITGIQPGKYYAYIAEGLDWNEVTGLFKTNALYSQIVDPVKFDTCGWLYSGIGGGYQTYEITLNTSGGEGVPAVILPPDHFPNVNS